MRRTIVRLVSMAHSELSVHARSEADGRLPPPDPQDWLQYVVQCMFYVPLGSGSLGTRTQSSDIRPSVPKARMHRQAIHRGRVAYEPNSLAGGCPFQAGAAQGFVSVAQRLDAKESADKVRIKPEKFADHYTQARLFFNSQSEAEQAHIGNAFRFELSKVQVPAIRQRVVARSTCLPADTPPPICRLNGSV